MGLKGRKRTKTNRVTRDWSKASSWIFFMFYNSL